MGTLDRGPRRGLPEDPEEFRLTLVEHLEELRDRIIRVLAYLTVGWVVGWFVQPYLFDFLNGLAKVSVERALGKGAYDEAFRDATQAFMLTLRLSFLIGLILAMPFVLNQLWGFIAPGLTPRERKPVQRLAPASLVLFATGVGFCWLVLPAAIYWFAGFIDRYPGVRLIQEPGTMVFFALKMMLAFGIAFQLPLIVYGLGLMGLLTAETLTQHWRQAATVIFILAAVITPSNDPISMLTMAVPLVLLFILSVYMVKWTEKKKAKLALQEKQAAEALE